MVVYSKPRDIAIIGWAWIAVATYMFAVSLLSIVTQWNISSVIVLLISVVYLIAAYRFLTLRSKAREMLVVLTWLALIAVITIGLVQCSMIFIAPTQLPQAEEVVEVGQFLATGLMMVVGVTVILALPLVVILRILKAKPIVEVFQQHKKRQEYEG